MRTDHSALTWLMSFRNLKGKAARWIQRLQEYNFTFEQRQGRKHKNAGTLSYDHAEIVRTATKSSSS
jgi:hypothetical protein